MSTGEVVGADARRLHALVLAAPFTLAAVLAGASGGPQADWQIVVDGSDYLLGGHLTIYADMPWVQMGPLALLPAALPGLAYMLTICGLLPVLLWWAVRPDMSPQTYRRALGCGVLIAWPWAALAVQGHGDEAFVALGAVMMLSATKLRRDAWVVVGFAIAVAAKPTAILLLPVAFAHSRRTGFIALFAGGLLWAPFVLADMPGFLAAGSGQGDLWPYSVPDLLGAEPHTGFPVWVRPVQLAGGLALCALLARRDAVAAVLAACAFRVLLEPGTWDYYSVVLVAVALVFDLRGRRRVPVATLLAFASFALPLGDPELDAARGLVRVAFLLGVLAVAVAPSFATAARRAGWSVIGSRRPRSALRTASRS